MAINPMSVSAAAEGFLAFMACIYAFAAVKSLFVDIPMPSGTLEHASGIAQFIAAAGVLIVVYAKRLRPHLPYTAGMAEVTRGVLSTLRPRLSSLSAALLAAHLAQAVVTVLVTPRAEGVTLVQGWTQPITSCSDATRLVWAPLFEELAFRVIVFSVVLQRTGGDVLTALALTTALFAGVHIPGAIAGAGTGTSTPRGYVGLQVLSALSVGAYLSCAYAMNGSLAEVALLHAANNAAAVVWMARDVLLGTAGAEGCKPVVTTDLLLAQAVQVALYAVCAALAWGHLSVAVGGSDAGEGEQTRFRWRHPIVYGEPTGVRARAGGGGGGED